MMKSKKDDANVTAHIACVYAHELILNPSTITKKKLGVLTRHYYFFNGKKIFSKSWCAPQKLKIVTIC